MAGVPVVQRALLPSLLIAVGLVVCLGSSSGRAFAPPAQPAAALQPALAVRPALSQPAGGEQYFFAGQQQLAAAALPLRPAAQKAPAAPTALPLWFLAGLAGSAAAALLRPPRALAAVAAATLDVSLEKPMGIVVEEGPRAGCIVGEVREGGSAIAETRIQPGQRFLQVGDVDVSSASFDEVMEALAEAESPVRVVLEELPKSLLRVTTGAGEVEIIAKPGDNLRGVLLSNDVDLYTLKGKMMNCNGGGQCTHCKVEVDGDATGEQTPYEMKKLKKPKMRLACMTTLEAGEATVKTLTAQ